MNEEVKQSAHSEPYVVIQEANDTDHQNTCLSWPNKLSLKRASETSSLQYQFAMTDVADAFKAQLRQNPIF